MEEKAVTGIPWTFLASVGNRVITVTTTIVLARLLLPAEFGLMALALVILAVINTSSEVGLASTLVARQDLDNHGKGTILTVLLALGAAVAVVTALLSPLLGDLFHQPRLPPILAALSATILISGLTWFYESLLQRELEFRRRFLAELARTVTYSSTAITLAALGVGVWSLVIAQLARMPVYALALLVLTPYRVAPAYSADAARDVLRTGMGFFVQGWAAFLTDNVPSLVVGRMFGAAQLAFYFMGQRLSELPLYGIAEPVYRVTFPGLARMRHEGQDVASSFLATVGLVALVACPMATLASATADPLVNVVLGHKWLAVIGPLSVLGIWGAVRPVQSMASWQLNALGHAPAVGTITALMFGPLVGGLLAAGAWGDITTAAWVILGHAAITTLVMGVVTHRGAGIAVGRQWRALRPAFVGCLSAWVVGRLVVGVLDGSGAVTALAGSALAGVGSYLVIVWLIEPGLLRRALTQVRRALRGLSAPAPAA